MTMKDDNYLSKMINKNISRRSFVKWTAAVGATASMSGLVVQSAAKMAGATSSITNLPVSADDSARGGGFRTGNISTWVPTHCLVCHGWCDLAVGIDDFDVIRKIEGLGGQPKSASNKQTGVAAAGSNPNSDDETFNKYCRSGAGYLPYSIHNRGRICAKGNDAMEHVYDPDRVKYPLERVGARGSGQWKRISWKEAYEKIGGVLQDMGKSTSVLDPTVSVSGTATDRRHRVVFWVGRNEDHGITDRFTTSYGVVNHVEHTSICESSRHTAQIKMMKDKFPLPWVHTMGSNTSVVIDTRINRGNNRWTLSWRDDCDLYVSCGGNVLEASIPHASYAQRVADVRRHGGRVVGIDVRQSNTLAWADEFKFIEPGTDAALIAGVIHTIMANYNGGVAALRTRLAARENNKYTGIFEAEAATGSFTANKTVESYVFNGTAGRSNYYSLNTPDGRAAGAAFDAAYAVTKCNPGGDANGVNVDFINYLAWSFSNNFGFGTAASPLSGVGTVPAAGVAPPRNPIIDGYRGICKHTNGTYTVKMVRTLQVMAVGHDDGTTDLTNAGLNEYQKRAGGVNRPGGLNHDVYASGGSRAGEAVAGNHNAGNFGIGGNGAGPSAGTGLDGAAATYHASLPAGQRIDNWDYTGVGGTKYKIATHKNDQNVIVGIRASLGLHPFIEGQLLNVTNTNPYGKDYLGNNNPESAGRLYDNNYKVEVLISHKNNPRYSRPNIALDEDTFTAIDPATGNYRLKNYFTIDMNMGDGSLFADIILAEGNFLERYANKNWENLAHKSLVQLRQPVRQVWGAMNNATITANANGYINGTLTSSSDVGVNLPLYESRTIWRILYELARAVEATYTFSSGVVTGSNINAEGVTPIGAGVAPWNNNLARCFNWSGMFSYRAERDWFLTYCNPATSGTGSSNIPGANAAAAFDYMRTNGVWYGDNYPNFFKGDLVEVFTNEFVDPTKQDPNNSEPGLDTGTNFFGGPVFVPIPQHDGSLPFKLTTYRLNVHTHARTASCPRLQEILGSSWAVMNSTTAAAVTGGPVVSGDTVELTTQHWDVTKSAFVTRTLQVEVKVTTRAQSNVISISHSQGHAIQSFGGDADSDGNNGYKVNTGTDTVPDVKNNRFHNREGLTGASVGAGATATNNYTGQPDQTQILSPSIGAAMDNYRWTLPPSAPSTNGRALSTTGHGSHPNWIINRASDPIGASAAFFDTLCSAKKI